MTTIAQNFNHAAPRYDTAAATQQTIARTLVTWAATQLQSPAALLDCGSGTGFVATELHQRWPAAQITALDLSPAMLREAKRKLPALTTITGDAATITPPQKFDAIFSSMALHWLPNPIEALRRWQSWLNPNGKLFVALPVEGSFEEWRALCRRYDIEPNLWPLPRADCAADLTTQTHTEKITATYPSPRHFLRALKSTGASTPRPNHKPAAVAKMRRLLRSENRELSLTYHVLFLNIPAPDPS